MLSDPQSITISTITTPLPATLRGSDESAYTANDGLLKVAVKHTYAKRTRRLVRLDARKIAADPLTAVNKEFSASVYVVFDVPKTGYTVAEVKAIADGFLAYLSAGSKLSNILGGES